MANNIDSLLIAGSLCLLMALIEAWLLVARFPSDDSAIARLIPGKQDLLRSHIDYLMMAQFLYVLYGLFRLLAVSPNGYLLLAILIGSFFNPFAFLVRAIRPHYLKQPSLTFKIMISTSCLLTTLGYGAAALLIASAAIA